MLPFPLWLTPGFQDRVCCFKRDCKTLFLVSQLGNKISFIASMLISQVQLIHIKTSSDLLSVKSLFQKATVMSQQFHRCTLACRGKRYSFQSLYLLQSMTWFFHVCSSIKMSMSSKCYFRSLVSVPRGEFLEGCPFRCT